MNRIRPTWLAVMIDVRDERVGADVAWLKNDVEEADQEPEDHRADDRAEDPGRATEEQHGVGEERHVGGEDDGLIAALPQREHEAGERTDHAAEDQRLHLVGVDVLAEAAHGVLVLADRLEHAAPRAAHQQARRSGSTARRAIQPTIMHPEVVGRQLTDAEPMLDRPGERVEVAEVVGERLQAVLAAEVLQRALTEPTICRMISAAAIVTIAR